ncbi:MAG: hypothetical protein Q7T96_05780 [Methylobacter sp.]|nr:hypothetical protein [Methylobacter sp.]
MTIKAQARSGIFLLTYNHESYIRQTLDALFGQVIFMSNLTHIADCLFPILLGIANALIPLKLKRFIVRVLYRDAA